MLTYFIALVGAFLAGCINTLAGNGSAITLTILTDDALLGLSELEGNGTNRVGILGQSLAATWAFKKADRIPVPGSKSLIIWTVVGALIGIYTVSQVSNEQFREVFRYLMLVMLMVILVRPKRWLRDTDEENRPPIWQLAPLYLALGFHAGFIQMGMGVLFLAVSVLIARFNIIDSNAIKMVIVTIVTAIALLTFALQGLVDWKLGGLMAIGQILGGYLTARFAASDPRAAIWAYRLLVVMVVVAVLRLFGLF